jgi:hypothetical protein
LRDRFWLSGLIGKGSLRCHNRATHSIGGNTPGKEGAQEGQTNKPQDPSLTMDEFHQKPFSRHQF